MFRLNSIYRIVFHGLENIVGMIGINNSHVLKIILMLDLTWIKELLVV